MIDCVVDSGAELGECPLWSHLEGLLYWVDIEGRRLHRYDPATGADEFRELPERPGSIAITADAGLLLVAMEHRLVWYDWSTDAVTEWIALEEVGTGNRLNDGRSDPVGRFWVGSMFALGGERRATGMLHRVEPEGTSSVLDTEIGVSNGLAFSPDGATMYFADTHRETVWRYDYDVDSGERRNETVFADFTTLPGRPDGACVDSEGCYWVAAVYGWAVLRLDPDGRLIQKIELPVEKPTMPAFGGPDLGTLFVTSIGPTRGSRTSRGEQSLAGGLFSIDASVQGLAEPVFAGEPPSRRPDPPTYDPMP